MVSSFIYAFIIGIFGVPVMMAFIARELFFSNITDRVKKIGLQAAVYAGGVALCMFLTLNTFSSQVDVMGYFTVYLLALCFAAYILSKLLNRFIIKIGIVITIITFGFLLVLLIVSHPASTLPIRENKNFKMEFIKTLNLRYISSNELYRSKSKLILNDTLVGLRSVETGKETYQTTYFFQSLKNPGWFKTLTQKRLPYEVENFNYDHGIIYTDCSTNKLLLNKISPGKPIQSFSIDTFVSNNDIQVWYSYKDLIMPSGVLKTWVFNRNSKAELTQFESRQTLMEDSIIIYNSDTSLYIRNLNNLRVIKGIKLPFNKNIYGYDKFLIDSTPNKRYVILTSDFGIHAVNLITGKVNLVYRANYLTNASNCMADNQHCYFNGGYDIIRCVSLRGKPIWHINHARMIGSFHNLIIANSQNGYYWYLIEMNSGKIIKKIAADYHIYPELLNNYFFLRDLETVSVYR